MQLLADARWNARPVRPVSVIARDRTVADAIAGAIEC
jgi:hypothetical protein